MSNPDVEQYIEPFTGVPDFEVYLPEIQEALDYQSDCGVQYHPYMERLASSAFAIRFWMIQEYQISVRFARDLAIWLGSIENCHVRALVIPVFAGEHGDVRGGRASSAHAVLAGNVLDGLGVNLRDISMAKPTQAFLEAIHDAATLPMFGAGFLGVGNERLLVPEYSAVLENVRKAAGDFDAFYPFLVANIEEDSWHAALIESAARGLASLGYAARDFYEGAVAGVNARMSYYDGLDALLSSVGGRFFDEG